jgi:hypothetical protein
MSGSFAAGAPIDPTKPLDVATSGPVDISKFTLTMIVLTDNTSYCIIDGKLYKSGDFIQGMKLKRIEHNKVILETDFGQFTLCLPGLQGKSCLNEMDNPV